MNLTALLIFHITAGSVGLAAGATALFAPKGAFLHRMAGNAFFIAMILMAVAGGVLAVLKPAAAAFNVVVAALTTYMVVTSWMTVQRKDREAGVFEFVALAAALAIAAGGVLVGLEAAKSPEGVDGVPDFLFYAFAAIATLSALADVSVIVRGGLAGAQRIARHLWRMCSALFLGTLAFFVGQGTNVFPLWVRETGLLPARMLIVLVVAIFWLVRVLMTDWQAKRADAPANRQPGRISARVAKLWLRRLHFGQIRSRGRNDHVRHMAGSRRRLSARACGDRLSGGGPHARADGRCGARGTDAVGQG